jgi:hypothetical protein
MTRWIVVAALVAACGKGAAKMDELRDAKVKEAKLQISMLAFNAYVQWTGQHSYPCPSALSELVPYLASPDLTDPWGTPYASECVPSQKGKGYDFRVKSAGPDGTMGTDDDLDSAHLNGD